MRKRVIVRIVSFYCFFAVLAFGIYYNCEAKLNRYKLYVKYSYESALETLSVNLSNIENALKKSVYTQTDSQLINLSVLLSRESAAAKSAIAGLPANSHELETVNKFLSQVGEYSLSLSKKTANGEQITAEDKTNLSTLSSVAEKIHNGIDNIYMALSEHADIGETLRPQSEQAADFNEDLSQIEQSLTDYPSLIYDGPFSDHINTKGSELLEQSEQITENEALKVAAQALSSDISITEHSTDEDGTIEQFGFKTDNNSFASVSKEGGYLVYMRRYSQNTGTTNLNYEQALIKAEAFLEKMNYKSMQPNYYFTNENICVINFAYLNGKTICYTDLIKVGVDLTSGEVVLFEARGYLQNHKKRNILTPKYTEAQAGAVLSDNLKVNSVKTAVIPTTYETEVSCYEFTCSGINGEDVLVYINHQNLNEEQIFILLKTDGGVLVK